MVYTQLTITELGCLRPLKTSQLFTHNEHVSHWQLSFHVGVTFTLIDKVFMYYILQDTELAWPY